MLAKLTDRLPTGDGWLFEPKLDGLRCIAAVDHAGSASLWSRHGASLTEAFPDIATAVAHTLPAGAMVDGEIVRWSANGRLDFDALQRRMLRLAADPAQLAAEPCHLVVFDLLRTEHDGDLTGWPLSRRRRLLQRWVPPDRTSELTLVLQTADLEVAMIWTRTLTALGVDGIVAKHADSTYQPGRRGWHKIQRYASTEVIVGGVTGSLDEPLRLIVGRRKRDGLLHMTGRTAELSSLAAEQIASVIAPPTGEHPWPEDLPRSFQDHETGTYHPVQPASVVEVRFDTVTRRGPACDQWPRRPRFRRLRPDLSPTDVPQGLRLEA